MWQTDCVSEPPYPKLLLKHTAWPQYKQLSMSHTVSLKQAADSIKWSGKKAVEKEDTKRVTNRRERENLHSREWHRLWGVDERTLNEHVGVCLTEVAERGTGECVWTVRIPLSPQYPLNYIQREWRGVWSEDLSHTLGHLLHLLPSTVPLISL